MTELPDDVVDRAEHLTRRARETSDEAAAREAREERGELLDEYGFTARVREDDDRAVLVCHPEEWVEGNTIDIDRIEDTDRAVEVPLTGPTDADWEEVAARNQEIVDAVAADHGDVHAANARALADYAENHHATTIDRLAEDDLEHFHEEYYRRNAWPSDEQKAVIDESIELALKKCESASDAPPR